MEIILSLRCQIIISNKIFSLENDKLLKKKGSDTLIHFFYQFLIHYFNHH